jgi:phosphoribosyl 1,2-cyclic phosphodiesterase
VSQVVDLAHQANVKNLYLFHHDPDQKDNDIDAKLAFAQNLLKERGSDVICEAPTEKTHIKI